MALIDIRQPNRHKTMRDNLLMMMLKQKIAKKQRQDQLEQIREERDWKVEQDDIAYQKTINDQARRTILNAQAKGGKIVQEPSDEEKQSGTYIPVLDAENNATWIKMPTKPETINMYLKGEDDSVITYEDVEIGSARHKLYKSFGAQEGKYTRPRQKSEENNLPTNFLLPSGEIVLSYDKGKTYTDTNGQAKNIPTNAIRTTSTMSGEEMTAAQARKQAEEELTEFNKTQIVVDPEKAARGGTGPWATAAAMVDAVVGGVGVDKIFTDNGIFPDTQQSRQTLRLIKQMGKSALMNSSRGAIWEQEKIDKLFPDPDKVFRNPSTESNKFKPMIETLKTEKQYNLRAIMQSITPEEIEKLRTANSEIDRLLALINPNPFKLSDKQKSLIDKYPQR
jgi:hypothetical protein